MRGPRTPLLNTLAWQGSRRFLHQLSPRTRVTLSQLPLTVTMLLVLAIVAVFHPEIMRNPLFVVGILLQAAQFLLCLTLPWHRFSEVAFLVLPLFDFVPIGLVRHAGVETMTALGALAAFPVVRLASSELLPRVCLSMCFYGPLLMVWVPLAVTGAATPEQLASVVLLPFIMLAIGFAVRTLSASMVDQQRSLEKVRSELQAALENSARKERLLNTVVDTVGVGVAAIDSQGKPTLVNRQQRRNQDLALLPGTAADAGERCGPSLFRRGGKEILPPEQQPLQRAAQGENFSEYLVWIGDEDRQRVYSTSARAIMDGERFDGSVVTFTDVSDLVAAMTAKDVFLSNVTHELRTPLTSILGYVEMLEDEPDLPAEAKTFTDVIRRNAQRLHRLVTDLLSASSGSVDVRPEPADFAEVVRHSLSTAAPQAAAAGVELVNEVPAPLPAEIDPVRTAQVVDNLLSNAIKYSPGGGTVTVRAWRNGTSMSCEVTDTGIGMTESESREVFSRFFRADAVRDSSIPGVGLGLAIAKKIVENHGGRITFTSEPGQGTTFRITLPVSPSERVHS
ncbi:histidine kinase [Arthrobacter crystallopoietes BAB-32]|uniref:histidine kinase n=1 Tax=Arthrobacter crystallopoietes BAB-32 TaxID=1246476 RepID=N1UV98_9MICC|nr:ATP-binding protein [Arthrobacter crystallopoietes]EMY34306.1 histidine kinase [Arthrobacter crystallopoietes BAB-32]